MTAPVGYRVVQTDKVGAGAMVQALESQYQNCCRTLDVFRGPTEVGFRIGEVSETEWACTFVVDDVVVYSVTVAWSIDGADRQVVCSGRWDLDGLRRLGLDDLAAACERGRGGAS